MFNKEVCKTIFVFYFALVAILITGCQGQVLYNQTQANIADTVERADAARCKSNAAKGRIPALVVNQGDYVDHTPIDISKEPTWLKNHIIIRGDELPFAYYTRQIVNGGGRYVLTQYQVGLDPTIRISMNYSGTVKGALDLLASKAGYVYSVNCNNVYWQAFVTKTFDVAFMPGSSDYMMGKSQGASGVTQSAGGQSVSAILDDSAASQYSNLKGTLSVWRDLDVAIKQLMSPDGKVMVSESTTTVTVRDRPTNIDLISKFIDNYNHNLSKQVLVKVQVLEITLSSDYVFGINWNVVQRSFGNGNYILNANFGTPVSITTLGTNTSIAEFGLMKGADPSSTNLSTGVGALINALTQQGKVSVVTEPRVVCLNNQVSTLRIVNQRGYLASVQNTTTSGGASSTAGNTITSQLTPGTVVTGFTLYMLPKIMDNKVYLQANADISVLNAIESISSATGAVPVATSTTPGSIIQVPNVTQKQFNQRSVIASGDTLILSGFRQVSNTANAMQLFDSQALGGKGAMQSNIETVVLITPIILHGCA